MDQQHNFLDLDDSNTNVQRPTNPNTLPVACVDRAKNNSAASECSQDSEASSNEFVKFDEQELANLPGADFLSQFGNRVASDALDSALEIRSDFSNNPYLLRDMDERDLYVPEGAGKAEEHPQGHVDLDEFDPLSSHQKHSHDLDTVLEQKKLDDFNDTHLEHREDVNLDEGQWHSKAAEPKHDEPSEPKHDEPSEPKHDEPSEPKHENDNKDDEKKHKKSEPPKNDPETPIEDNAGEDVIEVRHHSPLTHEDREEESIEEPKEEQKHHHHDYNEIAENIRDAVRDTHDRVDNLLDKLESSVPKEEPEQKQERQQHEEQYSPSGDSGHDTLGELANLNDNLPTSESVSSGMRDLSPELTTYERSGPLIIPGAGSHQQSQQNQQPSAPPANEDVEEYPYSPPRPPTPPKDLNDDDYNPKAIDLGPPPPHSHLTHRTSEHGLHSILKHNSDKAWADFRSIPGPVQEILLWRNPKNSAIALTVSLASLILVAKFTFLSLLAWGSLVVLGATLGFRVFKLVEAQVKKTDGTNPFKPYLEPELNVPQEKVHAQADVVVHHGQSLVNQLRRLFLVESVFDSVKFGVLLWTLTYIGGWFSGITLVTLFVLGLFSVPKVYELYKEPIDEYVGLARQNVEKVNQIVQEKLPFLKQAEAKAEKTE